MTVLERVLIDVVVNKRQNFYDNFNAYPRYVKIPAHIVMTLLKSQEGLFKEIPPYGSTSMLFCGLIVCPTKSIDSVDDIEVF